MKKGTVLITGASKGIGKAIAEGLFSGGYEVYGTSRNPDNVQNKLPGIKYVALDLADTNSIYQCFEAVKEIDILINNAGQSQIGPAEEIGNEKVREVFETNFFGAVLLTKLFLPGMRKKRNGTIINISSLSGRFASPFQSSYVSSKFAIKGWTLSLRQEVREYGIKACVIEPYYINSGIQVEFICRDDSAYPEQLKKVFNARKKKLAGANSPEVIVKTVKKILNSGNPRPVYVAGGIGPLFAFIGRFLPDTFAEKLIRKAHGL